MCVGGRYIQGEDTHTYLPRTVIIYDDNLSYRSLSRAKRNIYIFFFYLFLKERSLVKRGCSLSGLGAFKQHFLNEIHPEQFAFRLHEAFWDLRLTESFNEDHDAAPFSSLEEMLA